MSENEDTIREWGRLTRGDEGTPDVEAHWGRVTGRADDSTAPDSQSAEEKAEQERDDQRPDVEAHWSKCGG